MKKAGGCVGVGVEGFVMAALAVETREDPDVGRG
jgi:hypothetical protein